MDCTSVTMPWPVLHALHQPDAALSQGCSPPVPQLPGAPTCLRKRNGTNAVFHVLRTCMTDGVQINRTCALECLQVPEGEEWRNKPRPCATLRVYDLDFFRKIVLRHDTGLGEAYMDKVVCAYRQVADTDIYEGKSTCFCKAVLRHDTGLGETFMDKVICTLKQVALILMKEVPLQKRVLWHDAEIGVAYVTRWGGLRNKGVTQQKKGLLEANMDKCDGCGGW
eukprot:1160525-Pelagomonas_calceolata.AAC.3